MRSILVLLTLAATGLAAAARADSLWARAGNPANPFADTKARRTGDVVTVLIQETLFVSNDQGRDHKKESRTKFSVNVFRMFGQDKPAAEQPAVDWQSERLHKGQGEFESTDKVVLRLTATVKETLPNGNLIIEGTRQLSTGGEQRLVTLAGIVRPEDIRADNTVLSERIADARITYDSRGPVTNSASQGWGERIINFLWPF